MKFGYTIIYVKNVKTSLDFFCRAFGFTIHFLHEDSYGELSTGETTLAFASHNLGDMNLPQGYVKASTSSLPLGIEVAFVSDDVTAAHHKAVKEGATELSPPKLKPWGQTVSYLRCPDGTLVELCSPVKA